MPFTKISYSYLHTLACPYQAFLRYEGAIKSKPTIYLTLGNAAHLALEKMYLPNAAAEPTGLLTLDQTLDIFNTDYMRSVEEEEVFVGYPQLKKSQAEGIEMLTRYYFQMDEGIYSKAPFRVEEFFRLPIAGVEIVGKIDKVEKTANGLELIDYKTGKKKPDEWFLRRNLQFTAYYWACKELYGEYPTKIGWHHLRTGQLLETERTEWDVDQLKRIVEAAVKMQDMDMRYRVYHEQICGWCDYAGDNGECDDPNLEAQILARRETV